MEKRTEQQFRVCWWWEKPKFERVGQEKQQDVLGAKVDPQCLVLSTSLRLLSEAYHVAQRALHL